jgi:membrane protease YdiL (CAAX protease family)
LVILIAAAFLLITMLDTGRAVIGGSAYLKALFLGRTVALLLIATWLLHRRNRNWRDVGLRTPPLWRSLAIIPIGLVAIGIAVATAKSLLASAGYSAADYSAFRPLRGNVAEYLFWLVPVAVGSAAFGEEMIFRGFLLDAFRRCLGEGRWATLSAIVLQAAVFSLVHAYQGVGGVVTTGVVGLLLGVTWLTSGRNLWSGIVIHALLDGSAMTAVFLGLPIG